MRSVGGFLSSDSIALQEVSFIKHNKKNHETKLSLINLDYSVKY